MKLAEFAPLWDRFNREWRPFGLSDEELDLQAREWYGDLCRFDAEVVAEAVTLMRRTKENTRRPSFSEWERACNETLRARRAYTPPPDLPEVPPMTQAEKDGWREQFRRIGIPERHTFR